MGGGGTSFKPLGLFLSPRRVLSPLTTISSVFMRLPPLGHAEKSQLFWNQHVAASFSKTWGYILQAKKLSALSSLPRRVLSPVILPTTLGWLVRPNTRPLQRMESSL